MKSETPDPPVRKDGLCQGCGKPRKVTAEAMKYAGPALAADPWCSRSCCQKFHGAGAPETVQQRAARERAEAKADEVEHDRITVRQAIDRAKRERMFTKNAKGYTILKPEYQASKVIPGFDGVVAGIRHSSHGYKHHGCRCQTCREAIRAEHRKRRPKAEAK